MLEFLPDDENTAVSSLSEAKIVTQGKEIYYGEPCIIALFTSGTELSELRYCLYDAKFLTSEGFEPETTPSGLTGDVTIRENGAVQLTV